MISFKSEIDEWIEYRKNNIDVAREFPETVIRTEDTETRVFVTDADGIWLTQRSLYGDNGTVRMGFTREEFAEIVKDIWCVDFIQAFLDGVKRINKGE